MASDPRQDPRLGRYNDDGTVAVKPTQYSNGSGATSEIMSRGSVFPLSEVYFVVLPIGVARIDEVVKKELLGQITAKQIQKRTPKGKDKSKSDLVMDPNPGDDTEE